MSFPFFLVMITIITGGIWLLDLFVLKNRRMKQASDASGDLAKAKYASPKWIEYSKAFFPIFLMVLIFRSFWMEPFRIPSNAMNPNLLSGDFILVNKYTYGLKLPIIQTKILSLNKPQRGDVIVFHHKSQKVDMIRRVVGTPGDHIAYRDKILYINEKPALQTFEKVEQVTYPNGMLLDVERFVEEFETRQYDIYRSNFSWVEPKYNDLIVPEGTYFVMGDNRDSSEDSRAWGVVPERAILGQAAVVGLSWNHSDMSFRWERIGQSIF